ncbi:nitroreductase family protein [Bacillus massiliigorillae]|uniref:nitroreductase family protein n=1 Tax=Bacillus massiliigorillae TaxID=1243664 RepID=UPI0003A5A908|nr:nitroreductase family protein [Bacillus massiliigorillae]
MTNIEQNIFNIINERHSIREFDGNYKIHKDEIEEMIQIAATAPSSSNLQPWRFLIIQDENVKKELQGIAYNQAPIGSCSAVISVIGDTKMYKNVEKIYHSNFEAGHIDEVNTQRLIDSVMHSYPSFASEARANIASFDAGLISMQFMLIAKAKGYDTVTIGGFNKQEFAERFELEDRYMPIVLIALGKAAAPAFKTTRLPVEEIVDFI